MQKTLTVGDVMTSQLTVIGEDAPLRQARSVMVDHDIHHLPVVRGGVLVGILSDRDVKRALDPDLGLPPEDELFVRDACEFEPYSVAPATPLAEVLRAMASSRVDAALVAHDGRLAGILTASDACRLLADFLQAAAQPAAAPLT
ncbi:MAG: CBS domain-containing protein [Vicinamibacterales bacterium]